MGRNNRNKRAPKQPPSTATTKSVKGAHKSELASEAAASEAIQTTAAANQIISEKNKVDLISKDYQETLEGDLSCAICQDIYINPLMLNCSHSFCKFCVVRWLSKQSGCPQCRMKVSFQGENLALRNIINKMVQKSTQEFQKNRTKTVNHRLVEEAAQDKEGLLMSISKRQDSQPRTPRYRFVRPTEGESGGGGVVDEEDDDDDDNDDEEDEDNHNYDDVPYESDTVNSRASIDTDELIQESISELATIFAHRHRRAQLLDQRSSQPQLSTSDAVLEPRISQDSGRRPISVRQFILSEAEEDNEEESEEESEVEESESDNLDEEEADSYDDADDNDDEDFLSPNEGDDGDDGDDDDESSESNENESTTSDSQSDSDSDDGLFRRIELMSPQLTNSPLSWLRALSSDDSDDDSWHPRRSIREASPHRDTSQHSVRLPTRDDELPYHDEGSPELSWNSSVSSSDDDTDLRYSADSTIEWNSEDDDDMDGFIGYR